MLCGIARRFDIKRDTTQMRFYRLRCRVVFAKHGVHCVKIDRHWRQPPVGKQRTDPVFVGNKIPETC